MVWGTRSLLLSALALSSCGTALPSSGDSGVVHEATRHRRVRHDAGDDDAKSAAAESTAAWRPVGVSHHLGVGEFALEQERDERAAARGTFPAARRIVAVGDVHGDIKALRLVLTKAGVVDAHTGEWSGGDTVVVQVGDTTDRTRRGRHQVSQDEPSELVIMKWLANLKVQAQSEGGDVFQLMGNHELMNVKGEFRYASQQNIEEFGGAENRYEAFRPGGWLSKHMAVHHRVALRVGSWLFVHAGLIPELVQLIESEHWLSDERNENDDDADADDGDVAGMAKEAEIEEAEGSVDTREEEEEEADDEKDQQQNQTGGEREVTGALDFMNRIVQQFLWEGPQPMTQQDRNAVRLVLGNDGVVWDRTFSNWNDDSFGSHEEKDVVCARLGLALQLTGASHMVVGHTPQYFLEPEQGINSQCDGKVWRVDVGMSRAFDDLRRGAVQSPRRAPAALEILQDTDTTILKASQHPVLDTPVE